MNEQPFKCISMSEWVTIRTFHTTDLNLSSSYIAVVGFSGVMEQHCQWTPCDCHNPHNLRPHSSLKIKKSIIKDKVTCC